jgi:predicted ATP-grasp superfamily ATP-dependent carboligase
VTRLPVETPAVVIGPIDHVRPLIRAGVRCYVMAPPGAVVRYSRHVAGHLPWADPLSDPDRFVATLSDFAAQQADKPVLFCGGDFDLLAVSRARQALASTYRFILPDADLVEDLVDKRRFVELARRMDLPTPRSEVILAGGSTDALASLRYPIVIKPVTRNDARWAAVAGGAKVLDLRSSAELSDALERVQSEGAAVVAQEMVPGPEERVVSYHVYVDAEGSRAADFTGRKIRTYPQAHGHSTALEVVDLPEVRDLGRALVARLGLVGVAKLDFKEGPDRVLSLLEVNPRFTLWNHPGAIAGVNLPAMVYADLAGRPRPLMGPMRPSVRWCDPIPDAYAAIEHGMGLGAWLRSYVTAEARATFDPGDPGPVLLGAGWRLAQRLQRRRSSARPPARGS